MNRYHRLNLEVSTRCKICQDIEHYIESLTDEIERNKALLGDDSSEDSKLFGNFIEDEIEDAETQVKIAQRVIDEIMSNIQGDMHNVR